ncbi:MAG: hypothetical protein AMXMBFR84_45530 [Candidatus Hydrogenedentota bacterium]
MSHLRSACLVGFGVALGGIGVLSLAGAQVQAQPPLLPPIFEPEMELVGPVGPVKVKAVHGAWIQVESQLAGMDGEHWIYVPAQGGGWTVQQGETSALLKRD